MAGSATKLKKPLTQPQPFHFLTNDRAKASDHVGNTGEDPSNFRARPMTDFSKHKGYIFQRTETHSSKKAGKLEPEQDFHFRARPMPNFTSRPPTTITTSDVTRKLLTNPMPFNFHTDQRATRQLVGTMETVEQRQFRARPMPNFGKSPAAVPPRYLSPQKSTSRI